MNEVLYEDPYYGLIREMSREALESNILDLLKEKDKLNDIINKLEKEGYTIKRAKWEDSKCTNCKKSVEDLFSGDFYWDDDDIHYCPNCGARMDGD